MAPNDFVKPVIAFKKEGKTNPDAGLIVPVAFVTQEGNYEKIPVDYFPPFGEIFVAGGYTDDIDNIFSESDLFKVHFYQEKEQRLESEAKYRTTTRHYNNLNVEPLSPLELNMILDVTELPSADSPYVTLEFNNKNIFLCDNETILGPFEMAKDDVGYKVRPSERVNLPGLRANHVYKFSYEISTDYDALEYFTVNGETRCYIKDFQKNYKHIACDQEDFISDEALLKWGAARELVEKREDRPSRKALKSWKEALQALSTELDSVDHSRRERLINLLNEIEVHDEFWDSALRRALLSNEAALENYVQKHESDLLGKELDFLKSKLDKEEANLRQQLHGLKQEKSELENEIAIARQNKNELEDKLLQDVEKKDEFLADKIKKSEKRITELTDTITQKTQELELTSNIEDLQKKATYYEEHIKELERKEKKLKDSRLPEALHDLKLNLEVIHGSFNQLSMQSSKDNQSINISTYEKDEFSPKDYINFLANYIEDHYKRDISFTSLVNYIVSIANNFLVVFAGSPGCGKTSTAYFLAEALGLSKETGTFLPISVARGWTSQRDILGYFNPLNSSFQPARTGLSQFLKPKAHLKETLRIALLDEANLSPIEHYWADFLPMCDEEVCHDIDFGGTPEDNISVGCSTRFIATINNDNTTERLSPRLIDRAPIIRFSEEPINPSQDNDIDFEESEIVSQALLFENFESMFKVPKTGAHFLQKEIDMLTEIAKKLSGRDGEGSQKIFLSHRKLASMKRYCTVARELFPNDNDPLDYAIAQFILPIIEGFGVNFGKRLISFREEIKTGYPFSHAILDEIIVRGERNHHSYSYFE
ncbi:hypothetical protein [Maridesulfovibrio sp.]|uniref:hypothetical protein n=1 Tax=Maridesulfovibrio sp. TaxID=2795000 RepID=UPI003BAB98FF